MENFGLASQAQGRHLSDWGTWHLSEVISQEMYRVLEKVKMQCFCYITISVRKYSFYSSLYKVHISLHPSSQSKGLVVSFYVKELQELWLHCFSLLGSDPALGLDVPQHRKLQPFHVCAARGSP